jgi:insertion element IS1 protein InsB
MYYSTEWDEYWSYVGNKKNQRWTWYIVERKSGVVIAWENGKRKDEVLKKLLNSVEHLPIIYCFTDDWGAYKRLFPSEYQHITGKDNTWKIERKNLNFRTHIKRLNRKTICFSKNEQIHDNVIGMYIERFYYKYGKFSRSQKY